MKNWKKIMAVMCTAAMVSGMSLPVYAAAEATEDTAEAADPEIQDITESMLGLWQDDAGDIYGFYADYSFFGQWVSEETDVVGNYSLVTDGEQIGLTLKLSSGEESFSYVVANADDNVLEMYDEEGNLTSTLAPYEATGDEADYNATYQTMGNNLTECYMGTTDANETFIYADNDDGSFATVLAITEDDQYASFIGTATVDGNSITVTDDASQLALTFSVTLNDDDTLTLDLGDLGTATVEQAAVANAVQGLKYCTENGTPVN